MSPNPPDIQSGFVRTPDGYNLFWRTTGTGPVLACCNGVGVSTFFWKYVVSHFSANYRVLVWDYRGHGRSDGPADPFEADLSIERNARDLALVLDAIGAEDAVVLGHSMGCQVAFEFWHLFSDRVRGLIPILGSAGRVLETFYDLGWFDKVYLGGIYPAAKRLGPRLNLLLRPILSTPLTWPVVSGGRIVDPDYTSREDFLPYTEHLATLDIRIFIEMVRQTHRHDAFPYLPEIQAPVLIIAGERDDFTPLWLSRKMARLLPRAELLVLADASHAALIEQPETINHRIDRFLSGMADSA